MANLYENIISVAEAKHYLRLIENYDDDGELIEEDPDIERMIASALEYITKHTNYVFRVQNKTYRQDYDCNILIYDYPVNTTDFSPNIPLYYSGYIKFKNTDIVTASIGFTSKSDEGFPSALIDCALQIIKVYYYGSETNENSTLMPQSVEEIIRTYRRCIIV